MSETLAPLNPETAVAETAVAEALPVEVDITEQAQAVPEWSKPVQKLQQSYGNLERKMDERLTEMMDLLKQRSGNQHSTQKSRAQTILERLDSSENQLFRETEPEKYRIMRDMAEELAGRPDVSSEIQELRQAQANRDTYDAYMADKPPGFESAFVKEQNRVVAESAEMGETITSREARVYMTQWAKQWLAKAAKSTPAPTTAPGAKPIIPANTGARQRPTETKRSNPFGVRVGQQI